MKAIQLISFSLALVVMLLVPIRAADAPTKPRWVKIKQKNGITVYRKEDPKSDHIVFKAKGMVNKEMYLVLAVLGDLANATKWVERLKKVRLIKEVSDTERILWNQISAPWPLEDRDFVMHARLRYDHKHDWIHIHGKNVNHRSAPPIKGVVRIPYMRNGWSLKPIKKGMATWVEFRVQADPGGIIPAWVANMASKDVPYITLMKLRERVAQGKFSRKVLKQIKKYSTKHGLFKKYRKKYGESYIKPDEYYEKTYSLVP